ncbi:MAG TPA: aminotransferase class III-fold pyridoxal phosphate-dependent enzyme, partial [Candidatus Thermoplasmatota archaeon]|nr:aminotransferase class III-fold pyridoxal phosphate-dependent enzyme [Candidatus Thermoplasmatota archaeon]
EGRRYLDLLAGVAVNALGHAHPDIVAAVQRQVARLAHTSNLYAHEPGLRLAERLQALSPARHKVIFQNSGTEANEAALKLVRRHAHHEGMADGVVLAFHDSFHGRTLGSLALTGQPQYQQGYAPLPHQVAHVRFNDVAALEEAFASHRVAGVFFESVQGEGGVMPMDRAFADALGRLASRHGALLVADEIQTGIARTGTFFGFEQDGLRPDVITLAKGLGGGFPLGAALIHPRVAALFGPGSHGTTFGGNAVACAASHAVLDAVEREGLTARARDLGARFRLELEEACGAQGLRPRGRGLLLGLPLSAPAAPDVQARLREAGLLVGQAGKSVVRFAPPLVVGEDDLLGAAPAVAAAVRAALANA